MLRSLVLNNHQSPGDVLVLTAAVRSLHARYPGEFRVAVRTIAAEIWDHNPDVVPLGDDGAEAIRCEYPLIHESNQEPVSFLHGFCRFLGERLGLPLEPAVNRPLLFLSPAERSAGSPLRALCGGRDVPYWLLNAGVKNDYTLKQWPVESYQEVVDRLRGRVQFVQIGKSEHRHHRLRGVVDLVGRSEGRELIRLAAFAQGGLGPVTYLQHLCAAWEQPYVCLVGGREPAAWVSYPKQTTCHTVGLLNCCRDGACWRSRVVPLGDGDAKDSAEKLCAEPVLGLVEPVGRCLALIEPADVVAAIERALAGGVVRPGAGGCRGCRDAVQVVSAGPAGSGHVPRNDPPPREFAAVQTLVAAR